MRTVTTKIETDERGNNISPDMRRCVENLRAQAYEIQRRLDLTEQTASILSEMLDPDNGVAESVDDTCEANAFVRLRLQLFRLLIVDLCAGVLDKDNRTSSIRAILKELRRDGTALESIKAYYADPTCLRVIVEGKDLSPEGIEAEKQRIIAKTVQATQDSISSQWARIDTDSTLLRGNNAKRILWARDKTIAHYEKSATGLIALDDDPPYGDGKFTWDEPIRFFELVRPFVYGVIGLITSASWVDLPEINRFYARCFWQRFKNGSSDLEPEQDI